MLSYLKNYFISNPMAASALHEVIKGCGKRVSEGFCDRGSCCFQCFLFLMMILLIPLRIMRAQRRMQAVVESVCKLKRNVPMQSILCCRWQAVHWMEF